MLDIASCCTPRPHSILISRPTRSLGDGPGHSDRQRVVAWQRDDPGHLRMPVDVVIGAVAIKVPSVILQSASNATSTGLHATCIYTHESAIRVQNGGGGEPFERRLVSLLCMDDRFPTLAETARHSLARELKAYFKLANPIRGTAMGIESKTPTWPTGLGSHRKTVTSIGEIPTPNTRTRVTVGGASRADRAGSRRRRLLLMPHGPLRWRQDHRQRTVDMTLHFLHSGYAAHVRPTTAVKQSFGLPETLRM